MTLPKDEVIKDKNKKTAFIYSIDELFVYIVEIHYQDKSYYIEENKMPQQYGNIAEAKKVCREQNVEEAYLALSNSYQEVDPTTDTPHNPAPRYDFQKIDL